MVEYIPLIIALGALAISLITKGADYLGVFKNSKEKAGVMFLFFGYLIFGFMTLLFQIATGYNVVPSIFFSMSLVLILVVATFAQMKKSSTLIKKVNLSSWALFSISMIAPFLQVLINYVIYAFFYSYPYYWFLFIFLNIGAFFGISHILKTGRFEHKSAIATWFYLLFVLFEMPFVTLSLNNEPVSNLLGIPFLVLYLQYAAENVNYLRKK